LPSAPFEKRVRTGFSLRSRPVRVPSRSVGQLLWWVNYPLKQSVPTHRPDSVPLVAAGDLFPLVKKDPHHRRESIFRSRRGSYPHRTDSDRRRLRSRDSLRTRQSGPAIDNAIPRARTANLPRLAARRLSPPYRKKRPPPSPSFYGRVNNFGIFLASQVRRAGSAGRRPRQVPPPRSGRRRREALQTWGKLRSN